MAGRNELSAGTPTQEIVGALEREIVELGAQIVLADTIAKTARERRLELKELVARLDRARAEAN